MLELAVATALFVVSHELLSHPLRGPIVRRIGEKPFLGLYSLVAIATLGWAILAYLDAPTQPLWTAPLWLVAIGHMLMLAASILFAGSLIAPNPAMVGEGRLLNTYHEPRGVLHITRHPMMWAFALWAAVHIALAGRLETLILGFGIGTLALLGAHLQDGKKRAQLGDAWADFSARTSYWPFGAQLAGRHGHPFPGWLPIGLGAALYGVLVGLHPLLLGGDTRLGELLL